MPPGLLLNICNDNTLTIFINQNISAHCHKTMVLCHSKINNENAKLMLRWEIMENGK